MINKHLPKGKRILREIRLLAARRPWIVLERPGSAKPRRATKEG